MSRPDYACSQEQFEKDVANHEMTVLRDDGVNRHLRFKQQGCSAYWFDVLTWGGRLYIGGDGGTYVFDRLHDMFEFFRSGGSRINPSYWSEKVEAADRDGIEEFKWDRFTADVKDYFDQHWDGVDAKYEETDEELAARRAACWEEVSNELIGLSEDEYSAVAFIRDFDHEDFRFDDWERTSEEFTFRFIWNCRAIVWAIGRYDALKAVAG